MKDVDIGILEHAKLDEYWDGVRFKMTGVSNERAKLMALSVDGREELRTMPFLTLNGTDEIVYDEYYYWFNKAAKAVDLFILDDLYYETLKKRFVSPHWFRHEFVHCWLDRVHRMQTAAERKQEERNIAAYMKWGNAEGMLAWYSAHHRHKGGMAAAALLNEAMDKQLMLEEAHQEERGSEIFVGADSIDFKLI